MLYAKLKCNICKVIRITIYDDINFDRSVSF